MATAIVAGFLALTAGTSASAPAGQLDTTFGVNGVVRRNVSGSFVSGDQGNAILTLPDGKVLIAGQGGTPNGNFVLMQVLADGTPDPAFGVDGLTNNSFSPGSFSGAYALARQPDGRILAGGYANSGGSLRLAIVRYLPDGSLDSSFSGDGLATGFNIGGWPPGIVNGLVVQSDGKIVAVTDTSAVNTTDVVRLNADGSLDTSFGTAGRVLLTNRVTSSIAAQSDGHLIVAAATSAAPYKMVVTRLTVDGALDNAFGGAGTSTATVGNHASDMAGAVLVGPDDSILVGGKGSNGTGSEIAVARLHPDGTPDTSFGAAGYASIPLSDSYLAVHGLALQSDGAVVAVGGAFTSLAYRWFVARFHSTGAADTSFAGNGLITFESGDAMAVAIAGDGMFVTGAQSGSGDLVIYKYGTGIAAPPPTTTSAPTSTTTTAPSGTTTSTPAGAIVGSRYVPVEATRLLDTRTGSTGKVRAGGSVDVVIAGLAGVPSGATAVVANVTATDADAAGFVTVWPAGGARPNASSLNIERASGTIANLVTMPLGTTGALSLFSQSGTHLIVDLLGYYVPVTAPVSSGRFQAIPTVRVLDTRTNGAAPAVVDFSLGSVAGIPAGRASALVVNLTATGSSDAGFVTMWPTARGAQPPTSNLNVDGPGQTRANQVIVAVGDGTIRIATATGAHVLVDVVGYLTNDSAPPATSGLFVAFSPRRVLDTRVGLGAPVGALGAGGACDVEVRAHIPISGVAVVVGNVTATESAAPGFVTVWPHTAANRPEVSTLNLDAPDQTRANHAIVALATDGTISVFSQSGTHAIVDLSGGFLV